MAKSEIKTTIIRNTQNAYVAELYPDDAGNRNHDTVVLTPIIAWSISLPINEGDIAYAIPVTVENDLSNFYAIYYPDTKKWIIAGVTTNTGFDLLRKELQTLNNLKG